MKIRFVFTHVFSSEWVSCIVETQRALSSTGGFFQKWGSSARSRRSFKTSCASRSLDNSKKIWLLDVTSDLAASTAEVSAFLILCPLRVLIAYTIIAPMRITATMQPTIVPASAPWLMWLPNAVELVTFGMIWTGLSSKSFWTAGDVHDDGYLLSLEPY